MKKIMRGAVLLLVFVILIAGLGVGALLVFSRPGPVLSQKSMVFSVVSGDSGMNVISRLEQDGAIKSSLFLKLYARTLGRGDTYKIGNYQLNKGMNVFEVHRLLVEGRQDLYKVTFPEGFYTSEIAERLEAEGITGAEEFLDVVKSPAMTEDILGFAFDSLDGFLYPDTYYFQKGFPAEMVARAMVSRFFEVLEEVYPGYKRLNSRELFEKVTLASVVQLEFAVPEEAAVMSSVFYNRLDVEMPLQSCASVLYVYEEELGQTIKNNRLLYEHTRVSSPYNTYIHKGLPPGPISNPGFAALQGVFYPERSNYLFFVKKAGSQQHVFTETYKEHLEASRSYVGQTYGGSP